MPDKQQHTNLVSVKHRTVPGLTVRAWRAGQVDAAADPAKGLAVCVCELALLQLLRAMRCLSVALDRLNHPAAAFWLRLTRRLSQAEEGTTS